jgi:UPF0716 protein FxsA
VLARFLLVLILLPVAEIAVLIWLADATNWLVVIGLLIGAGLLGAYLARQQGLRSLARLNDEFRRGQMPAESLVDAMFVSVAALLLILPGLLSDVVAILLLWPVSRRALKAALRRGARGRVVTTYYTNFEPRREDFSGRDPRDEIIDVKVIER